MNIITLHFNHVVISAYFTHVLKSNHKRIRTVYHNATIHNSTVSLPMTTWHARWLKCS